MDSINQTINALESHDNVDRTDVQIDGDKDDLIVSAFVDDVSDEFVDMVEEDLGMSIKHKKYVVFGYEVTLE